jgi:hypothetical protein
VPNKMLNFLKEIMFRGTGRVGNFKKYFQCKKEPNVENNATDL